MIINGISGQSYGSKPFIMDMGSDSTGKNLQSQIANAQKQMQELASNKEMSPEDKMNKRKEIQEQINELQNQLRQHLIEQRKENLQRSTSSMEDMLGGSRQNSQVSAGGTGMSSGNMQAILSADSAMTQVKAQGSARAQVKGEAKVLKAEIKQDGARGANVEKKQEQLAEIEFIIKIVGRCQFLHPDVGLRIQMHGDHLQLLVDLISVEGLADLVLEHF